MKAKIFTFHPVTDKNVLASARIVHAIHDELGFDYVRDGSIADEPLDVLIIVNGAYIFSDNLDELGKAITECSQLVWVQNDYTIKVPIKDGKAVSKFRAAFRERYARGMPPTHYWTTCDAESRATPQSHYINWNCLTCAILTGPQPEPEATMLYYGGFRTDRRKAFDQYFTEPKVPTVISCPGLKGRNKFAEHYRHPLIRHVPRFIGELPPQLASHGLGLYLEDRRSHGHYHSPPNRFYEMLGAGLPMVFQQEAGATLRRAGYRGVDTFAVNKPLDIARRMDLRDDYRKQQRDLWLERAVTERAALPHKITEAWSKLLPLI